MTTVLSISRLANEMVCRKCKRAVLFATQIEPDYDEEPELDEEDWEQIDDFVDQLYSKLGITGIHPIAREAIKDRIRRKLLRLSTENQLRLLAYLG
jgi:hypothetical protein